MLSKQSRLFALPSHHVFFGNYLIIPWKKGAVKFQRERQGNYKVMLPCHHWFFEICSHCLAIPQKQQPPLCVARELCKQFQTHCYSIGTDGNKCQSTVPTVQQLFTYAMGTPVCHYITAGNYIQNSNQQTKGQDIIPLFYPHATIQLLASTNFTFT